MPSLLSDLLLDELCIEGCLPVIEGKLLLQEYLEGVSCEGYAHFVFGFVRGVGEGLFYIHLQLL